MHDVPPKGLMVQITETYTLRTIVPCVCSEQFLIETGWKRKNPTNTCSGAEMLEISIGNRNLVILKRITFPV